MKVASLDLGTNTFLLLVCEVEHGKIVEVLHDEVRVVRLGQGVHESRAFHPEALERVEDAFKNFSAIIRRLGVERVLACATSAARDVTNKDALIELGKKYQIPIEIISGEREAELTFLGTIRDDWQGPVVIIDVGGGSTEFILGDETGLIARKSFDVGSVRLTEKFVTGHPIEPFEIAKMTGAILKEFGSLDKTFPIDENTRVIAVAGTPTTLATIDMGQPFEHELVDGYRLSSLKLKQWANRLSQMTIEERQQLAGMEPKRADVIVAGTLVLIMASEVLHAPELEVSVRGLRYGIVRRMAKEILQ